MVRIPEGWFVMGCPADREVGRRTTSAPRIASGWTPSNSPHANSPTPSTRSSSPPPIIPSRSMGRSRFHDPGSPSSRLPGLTPSPIAKVELQGRARPPLSPPHRSRMGTRRARRRRRPKLYTWGDAPLECASRITPRVGRRRPSVSASQSPAPTASSTWARTSTSGAPIGTTRSITPYRPIEIRPAPPRARAAPPAVAPGATPPKSPASPRAPAFLPNLNTPITASASPVLRRGTACCARRDAWRGVGASCRFHTAHLRAIIKNMDTLCPQCHKPMTCTPGNTCWCAALPHGPMPSEPGGHRSGMSAD